METDHMRSYPPRLLLRSALLAMAVAMGVLAPPGDRAQAQIDISGDWNATFTGDFSGMCTAAIQQTGTDLVAPAQCSLIGSGILSGSIDPATGDFSLSSDPIGMELEGTASEDGNFISGTWNALGLFSGTFTGTRKGEPTDGQAGDVDCSGGVNASAAVNSIDAALLLQHDAGLIAPLPCPQNADVNEDGAVNSLDASLILQFDAGLIASLP